MKCSILRGALVLFLVADFAASAKVAKNVDWYPEITDFPQVDLVSAGDVNEGETLKIPCKARGAKPLNHTWYLISQGKKEIIDIHNKSSSCSLDADGSLVCRNIKRKDEPQTYQCYVSNHYGKVFSPELKVDVTAIRVNPDTFKPSVHQETKEYYINNNMFVLCPYHKNYLGANYAWVYKNSTSGEFVPLPDSRSYAVTSDGALVYAHVKKGDLSRPLHCKVSAGSTSYISGYIEFSEIKSSYTPVNPVGLTEGIYGSHTVLRGTTKILRCIPKGYPIPKMSWWKDGEFIVSGRHNIKLQSFNRILIVKNANDKQHTGTYVCGIANPNETIKKRLAKAQLVVEGPPVITDRPPKALTASEGKSFSLYCNVRNWQQHFPSMTYYWYKNGEQLKYKWEKITFSNNQRNLTVFHLESQDSGVYQCEVLTVERGMTLKASTSTRIHVKVVTCDAIVPPSNARFKEHKCRTHSFFLPRTTCTWSCKQGFIGTGRRDYTECQADGTWLAIKYKCEDIEPPRLKKGHGCPSSITMATKGPNDRGREVSWNPPVGEDNSGKVVTKVEPPGINGKDDWFQLGLHPIKYTFTDATGHNATCQFNITVFSRTKIITKSPRHITIMKHEPLELKCIANSDPSLHYTWKKSLLKEPNKTITITKHSHVQVLDGGKRLVMRHVKDDDAGTYTCEVINRRYNASGARDMAITTVDVVKAVEWSPWKQWSSCKSKGCGYKGHKTRRRECLKKNSTHLATGCKGDDNQIKSCTVPCSTLQPDITTVPPTGSSILDISSIKNAIKNYNGWFKSHYPKLFHYLNTRTGKVAFACALAACGISIVLICWSCNYYISRRRQRKRMVKFSDEDYVDSELEPLKGEDEGLLVDQDTEQTQDQILQEPMYGNQQMEYFEGGYYGETYPEGYNYYYEDDVGYDEGEIVYEMTG